jgi:hypothetical protein
MAASLANDSSEFMGRKVSLKIIESKACSIRILDQLMTISSENIQDGPPAPG